MNDNGAANDGVRTSELEQVVGQGALGDTLAVALDVAQITDMAVLIGGCTVVLAERVEVRASTHTSVGGITKRVDVEAEFVVGLVAREVILDGCGLSLSLLLKVNSTFDGRISTDDSNCSNHWR